jgi:hypothetical protein
MNDLGRLAERFDQEVVPSLKRAWDVQADTRIPGVSLYDHLVLTAGFAVAMVEELCLRGKTPEEICGLPLSREELRVLARLGGLFHDLGKARVGKTEYRFHVERGMEYAESLLASWRVVEEIRNALLGIIGITSVMDRCLPWRKWCVSRTAWRPPETGLNLLGQKPGRNLSE